MGYNETVQCIKEDQEEGDQGQLGKAAYARKNTLDASLFKEVNNNTEEPSESVDSDLKQIIVEQSSQKSS